MMLQLFSAIALTFLCSLNTFAAREHHGLRYLSDSKATWNNNRLTAELKDAPVKRVLEDLMESEGFACQVTGDLQGTISITIDNLTVEETIHKIMRNRKYNYTMILDEPESQDSSHAAVSVLTIYQGNDLVRFVKVNKRSLAVQPKRDASKSTSLVKPSTQKPVATNTATGEEFEKLDEEIKSFMDEMLAKEKISKHDYDDALRELDD